MQQKRQFNFLYLFLIMGLLFVGGPLFSQDPNSGNTPASESAPQDDHNSEDLEELLKKYNKDSEKILEDTSKLHNIQNTEAKSEVNDTELEEVKVPTKEEEIQAQKSLNGKKGEKSKVLPTDLSSSVRMAIEPLQKLSEEELLKRLDEGSKDSPVRPYLDKFPNLKLLSVRLIKDKESLPSLVKIVENKDRLIYFVSAMLFSVIFGFILKRALHKEGQIFIIAALIFILRFFIMLALRLMIIHYFFSKELAPALEVFKKTVMT